MGNLQYTREVTDSIRYNRFLNNQYDVQNVDGRDWFIPENYFVHGENEDGTPRLATAIDPATSVSCYPMATRVRNGETQRDDYTYYYNYEQLDYDQIAANQVYRLSNRLTGSYPTPAADLDGKIFEVVDEENGSSALAVFSFPEAQTQSQARIALFAAGIAAFDATVSVERTGDRIVFNMNDPCKPVTVTLPCAFQYGTVTHNSAKLENVTFDGETVSFETAEGGEYTIKYELDGYVIAAGYDAFGRLVGVQFLSAAELPVKIPGAVTVKRFTVDRFYRPIALPQKSK